MSLLRTGARAYVATRVIGSTHRRQQQRWAAQDAAAQAQAQAHAQQAQAQAQMAQPQPVFTPAPSPAQVTPAVDHDQMLARLGQLGQLRDAGVLSQAEFEAQKARILAGG